MVTHRPDEHVCHWSMVAIAGVFLALGPMLAEMFGVAAGPATAPAIGVAAVIMLAGCWAVVGSGDIRPRTALAALVGGVMVCVPLAAMEWAKYSPAPAAAAPFYTLATLPWILVPLAGGVAGIVLGHISAARGAKVRDPDRCPRCGYALELALAKCPECGLDHSEAGGYRDADAAHRRDHPAWSLVLLTIGLLLFGASVIASARQIQALSYPSVVADASEIFAGKGPRTRRRPRPVLVCSYSYTVSGTAYLGERVSYSQWRLVGPTLRRQRFLLDIAAERCAARINAGGPRVYYNPADPSDATLTVGLDGAILYRLLAGMGLAAWGAAGVMPLAFGPVRGGWPRPMRRTRRGLATLGMLSGAATLLTVILYSCIGLHIGGAYGLIALAVCLAGAGWAAARAG